jgi:hypothetical protein
MEAMSLEKNQGEQAVHLIKAVLQGEITPEAALAEWPTMSKSTDRLIGNAHHQLSHYFADEDIRSREPDYEKAQRVGLQQCMDELLAQLQSLNKTR